MCNLDATEQVHLDLQQHTGKVFGGDEERAWDG